MPLFDYACGECGSVQADVLQAYSAAGPSCCGRPMDRLKSAAAFTIEGFSAKGGYTTTSSGKQPEHLKGIRTRVYGS